MKVAGIVAEYNPFHTGHGYHIMETRRRTGAEYIVAVMSGDYVQRGEPACTDKYLRTRMALVGGADVVMELPVVYATASAEYFATAGVKLLTDLNCVDYLSFGSERASLKDYELFVQALSEENKAYQSLLRGFLKQGYSFPRARSSALQKQLSGIISPEEVDDFLREPNHILGLEYLKALQRLHSPVRPIVVARKGAAYHDLELRGDISSASAIRAALKNEKIFLNMEKRSDEGNGNLLFSRLQDALGENTSLFLEQIKKGESVIWEDLMPLLDYEILMRYSDSAHVSGVEQDIFGADQELMNRIRNTWQSGASFSEIIRILHSKNRTDVSIQRALLHILLQIRKWDLPKTTIDITVPYARVLGFRKEAAGLLKQMRVSSDIPVIQRPSEGHALFRNDPLSAGIYQKDILAAELYNQVIAGKTGRKPVSELKRSQIIL